MSLRTAGAADTQSEHKYLAMKSTTQMQSLCQPTQKTDRSNRTSKTGPAAVSAKGSICERPNIIATKDGVSRADEPSLGVQQETSDMTWDHLEEYLTPEVLQRLEIKLLDLAYYHDVNKFEPPITRTSLGELDLARIINDPKLRHDINFEPEISFKPNVYGEHLQEKLDQAQMYWEALTIEFAFYSQRQRQLRTKAFKECERQVFAFPPTDLAILRRAAVRLPHTFATIREILKTLVPGSEWAAIDERLDVDLLIQELENGVCDVRGLADWLGQLLLRSCSPLRDDHVDDMVALIQKGADKDVPRLLAFGMKDLFGILETMRLDVANHQIRYLRLLMIDDTVHFEQKTFLHKIACGWSLSNTRAWIDPGSGLEGVTDRQLALSDIVRALVDLVRDDRPLQTWPSTLLYDADRLMSLKLDLHVALYRRACFHAFDATVRAFGIRTPLTADTYQRLWTRIEAVLEIERSDQILSISNRASTLEIVREACRVCKVTTLPDESSLSFAEWHVYICIDPHYRESQRLRADIGKKMTEAVKAEVQHLVEMTPLQMLNCVSQQPRCEEADEEKRRLSSIARRLAHISILHWRIWGPILYHQPHESLHTPTGIAASMNALSLTEPTSEHVVPGPEEEGSWSGKAMPPQAIEAESSTTTSSIDSLEIISSEDDSKGNNEPLDDLN